MLKLTPAGASRVFLKYFVFLILLIFNISYKVFTLKFVLLDIINFIKLISSASGVGQINQFDGDITILNNIYWIADVDVETKTDLYQPILQIHHKTASGIRTVAPPHPLTPIGEGDGDGEA